MQANVLIEIKSKAIDKTFTYNIPINLKDKVKVGIRVLVPFGNRKLEGFVMDIGDIKTEYKIKDIIDVIDEEEVLTEELINLGKYMSRNLV